MAQMGVQDKARDLVLYCTSPPVLLNERHLNKIRVFFNTIYRMKYLQVQSFYLPTNNYP